MRSEVTLNAFVEVVGNTRLYECVTILDSM
jgi:hypothetical protein